MHRVEAIRARYNSPSFSFLLPSFFHMITKLLQDDIQFQLIFRSFGKDFNIVRDEWNAFVQGQHPWWSSYGGEFDLSPEQREQLSSMALAEPVISWNKEVVLEKGEGGVFPEFEEQAVQSRFILPRTNRTLVSSEVQLDNLLFPVLHFSFFFGLCVRIFMST